MAQLGTKLNITRQGVKKIEESEANGTITIKTLKEVAAAMEMKLVYSMVPKDGTIDELIHAKSERLAKKNSTKDQPKYEIREPGNWRMIRLTKQ